MVLTGRDKGKQGTVLRVLEDSRVLVESVNMIKRHTKPNPNKGVTGGIIDREAPIHISNVCPVQPGRRARVSAWESARSPTDVGCVSSSPTTKSWTPESRSDEMAGCRKFTGTRSSPSS